MKIKILLFALCLLSFLGGFLLSSKAKTSPPKMSVVQQPTDNYPYLDLPIKYFPEEDRVWSSGEEQVSFKGESEYRSYPTKQITIKDFTNTHETVPKTNTLNEILSTALDDTEKIVLADAYNKYPEYSGYLPAYFVDLKDSFDVDIDGKNEMILSLGGVGGNHFPHITKIIKNNEVIFSVEETQPTIEETKTHDGFYVNWSNMYKDFPIGQCCPTGSTRTRFVFKDNKFIPVWEQEIKYIKIGNPK